jgi:hypothetical protein
MDTLDIRGDTFKSEWELYGASAVRKVGQRSVRLVTARDRGRSGRCKPMSITSKAAVPQRCARSIERGGPNIGPDRIETDGSARSRHGRAAEGTVEVPKTAPRKFTGRNFTEAVHAPAIPAAKARANFLPGGRLARRAPDDRAPEGNHSACQRVEAAPRALASDAAAASAASSSRSKSPLTVPQRFPVTTPNASSACGASTSAADEPAGFPRSRPIGGGVLDQCDVLASAVARPDGEGRWAVGEGVPITLKSASRW